MLALETAAKEGKCGDQSAAELALCLIQRLLKGQGEIQTKLELALLSMQALPRLCKLLMPKLPGWLSLADIYKADRLDRIRLRETG